MATVTTSASELCSIRDKIEQMNKHNQVEILKILVEYKSDTGFDENANGVYINLCKVKQEAIERLQNYVKFVESQENYLHTMEQQTEAAKKCLDSKK